MHIKDYMHHMDFQEHFYWRKLIKKENPNRVFLSEYDYWNSVVNLLRAGRRYPKRKNVKLDFSAQ